ncbi:uncharacterized protein LOC117645650 [Thrips palmi]|uniref:Uncharacterized protein LOC117645650 n=1 Tax=Thrips palmi TaxID=161013 RepID=A0A6P8YWD4_THRPL|nr:uncharacterized protein LOC117645650 [Thrips palmi]XP_034241820.1 uncharacterized protein LOC117645650 [Thrips palmi]
MDLNKARSGQRLLRSPTTPPDSPPIPTVSPEGKAKVDRLIDQVDSILLSDDVLTSKVKEPYVTWCLQACVSSDILKYAVERLHYYWLGNRSAVAKASLFLCANWFFEVDGVKMRQELLLCLQGDFENRLELQGKSPQRFLHSVAFLVEMFTKIRIENQPMQFLTTPVFQSLEDLLTGDDSEIELFAHLVVGIGPTLQDANGSRDKSLRTFMPLQNLFCKIRSTLMSRNLSSQSRLWLLFIMDISSSGDFCQPSSTLQTFYLDKENLGPAVNCLIKSIDSAISSHAEAETLLSVPQAEETVSAPLVSQTELKEPDLREQMSDFKISPKPLVTNGAFKTGFTQKNPSQNEVMDKREGFRSALNTERSKGNRGKSFWQHDDRFERDDLPVKERNTGGLTKPRASDGNWRRPTTPKDEQEKKSNNEDSWRPPSTKGNRGRDIVKTYSERQPSDSLSGGENWD